MNLLRGTLGRMAAAGLALLAPKAALAQAKAGLDTTPPSTWRFQLSADGTWYENAYFLGTGVTTAWSTSGQATLSHERRFRNGSFSLSGFGGAIYYPQIDNFNQPTYGGSLGLTSAPSRRTQLRLGQSYQRSNTRYLTGPDAQGLPLPTSAFDDATSSAGLVQGLSQRFQLSVDGQFVWRRYDDEQLRGGEQLDLTAQLARLLGRRGALYLGYGYTTSWLDSGQTRSHTMVLGGRRKTERGVGFELAGGTGYVESTGQFYPTGRAGLTASGRRSSLSLLYYRDFGQAFGYGRQTIGDLASASLNWTPVRRLNLNAGYNFGYRRDPVDESYTIRSHVASAGVGWDIGKGLSFGARYSWERSETQGEPVLDGGRASATLSYGVDWK